MSRGVLTKSVTYEHPPQAVWLALTDARALAEWMMPNDFPAEPSVGDEFTLMCDPIPMRGALTHARCRVLECEPNRRLSYSLLDVIEKEKGRNAPETVVTYALEALGDGGTRLTLTHSGLDRLGLWTRLMAKVGWMGVFKQLGKVLANVSPSVSGEVGFTPGAVPLEKRCYKVKTIPTELTR